MMIKKYKWQNLSLEYFWVHFQIFSDIDQLTRILALCGTPTQETMDKISSVEVGKMEFLVSSYMNNENVSAKKE